MSSVSGSATSPLGPRRRELTSASFLGLAATQLLTATNDNTFRWLVIGVGKDYVDPKDVGLILMLGTAAFVLPYLLLAAPAGFLADRFCKRDVIIGCKIAELAIMALGVAAIASGQFWLLFVAVFLMGAQSALFAPSKLGSIPELLRPEKISQANGVFGLTTVAATVIGMAAGSYLSDVTGAQGRERWWLSAIVLLGLAAVGLACSLLIRKTAVADPTRRFPWDAPVQSYRDIRTLASHRPMLRVAMGIMFFWAIGAIAQLNIDQFAAEGGALGERDKIPLLIALVVGVGVGSIMAGVWSGGRVELGILPLGALGMAICSMLLFTVRGVLVDPATAWTTSFVFACVLLLLLGGSAGLFSVPLEAFMQHRSPRECRGAILSAKNFLTFSGVLISSLLYYGFRAPVYEGSLDNVPASLRGAALSPEAARRVDRLAADYREAWRGGARPDLDDYLAQAPPSQQGEALAQLLWVEFRQLRERGEFLDKYEYFQRFPGQQPLVKCVYDQATDLPLFTSQQVFLLAGVFTVPVFLYIVWLIPQASLRFLAWLLSRTAYRIRVYGREHLPSEGGSLLVSNHVSYLDGVLLLLTSTRPIRMVMAEQSVRRGWWRWCVERCGAILMGEDATSIDAALQEAGDALQRGELVCLFPEGAISPSGQVQPFKSGVMRLLQGVDAPIVPVYLDELWGSIFSLRGGKSGWKWPRKWPYPVSIFFGKPLRRPADAHQVRGAVQELGAWAVQRRTDRMMQLPRTLIRNFKRRMWRETVADSLGASLTGGKLFAGSLVLRRLLRRHVLPADQRCVGVLLPPSAGGFVANVSLALDRRVAINLNYTVSSAVVNQCIAQAEIRQVLTSRAFLDKIGIEVNAEVVLLEDLRPKATMSDKLVGALQAFLLPARILERWLKLHQVRNDDLLTIIFTSGSTGEPKGVMLSHGNVASNVEAVEQVVQLNADDVVIGVLPFFHSFGYSITLWTIGGIGLKGVYHFNPLDGRQVGKLCGEHGATILLATPTFLRHYLRRCEREQLAAIDVCVAGAEKLPRDLCDAFERKFGIRPVEGYGATELSPLVSVNLPASRYGGVSQVIAKEGTVGRPVPGVIVKTVDLDSGEDLGVGQTGMLLVKGPNVMQGYLGRPELTAQVIRDGWYVTGDVAKIDEDGFIVITGRESRFSKIGGEMVPHIEIEEALARIIGGGEDEGLKAVVTSVPDAKKGERLIVVHTQIDQTPEELTRKLAAAGLPNLYIPSADSFCQVDALPLLGSGKLDLKAIHAIALEKFGNR